MLFCFLITVICIVLDQLTKYLAVRFLSGILTYPLIENVIHLTYVENRGAAFGMLSEHRWVFMLLSVVGIAALCVWLAIEKPKSMWLKCAASLIIGGGIGNMIDRVRLEYVIDFIDCRFIDFYVFNVADSFVCIGCAMFIVYVIASEIKDHKAKKERVATEENK